MKGVLNGMTTGNQWLPKQNLQTIRHFQEYPLKSEKLRAVAKASVFTFKKGIGELAERLESKLRERANVRIMTKTRITGLRQDQSGNNISVCQPSMFRFTIKTDQEADSAFELIVEHHEKLQ